MAEFVHLHLHTEYSLLDGLSTISKVVKKAGKMGMPALAMTDHGNMYGSVAFYDACCEYNKKVKDSGDPDMKPVKPIFGTEFYVCDDLTVKSRKANPDDESDRRHLVCLAKNETGYKNIAMLNAIAFRDGFYYKPRIDLKTLKQYSEGIVCLSACIGGDIPQAILRRNYDKAEELVIWFKDVFGEDFYLEMQDHGLKEELEVNQYLRMYAKKYGIKTVVTNDVHYIERSDAEPHDVLLCVQTGRDYDDPNRMKFQTDEFYLKSEEELARLFPGQQEALENTQRIADRCNLEFVFNEYHLPSFPVPDGYTNEAYFRHLCMEGFAERYPNPPESYKERLEYEIDVISRMCYVNYYLIVWDFIRYAKESGIPVGPGRGSGAASIVAYCMHITEVDPMKYALIFERFLNPERVSMPDFDTDFCQERRGEVIDYVMRKYGADHVAQIATFGTMAARGAIRDVGRALNFSFAQTDVVAKLVPTTLHITLKEALVSSPKLREMYDNDEKVKQLIDTAMSLEGMPRNTSTHAAGVVITADPVYTYVPLSKNDDTIVTQYTMTTIEELGLLKMDFLGLRNLTVIEDAEQQIRKQNPDFNIDKVPDDAPDTFQILADGKTQGVFQLESAGITGVCVNMKPTSIEDMTAIVALYRPGPMDSIPRFIANKLDPRKITYKTPHLEPILKVTYGCIVYQEQVIEIFRSLGGYTMGQADNIRRAISKKKMKVIESERKVFVYGDEKQGIPGCIHKGIPEAVAQSIYDEIVDFANYAFNKAHAVCYAVVSYQTAYLKCHYPHEYMAALMTSVLNDATKISGYIAECKELGIATLPPDINRSDDHFTVENGAIRFGMGAIKNVGRGLIRSMVAKRTEGGPFRSLEDFLQRMGDELNKRAVENFIKCGAMDGFGYHRSELLSVYEEMMDSISSTKKRNLEGQMGLFSLLEDDDPAVKVTIPSLPEKSKAELMLMEKETTGIYLSGHPMDDYRAYLKKTRVIPIGDLMSEECKVQDEQVISIAGVVQSIKMKTTRNNSMMAYATLEDDTGSIEMLVFSNALNQFGGYLVENAPVVIVGKFSVRDEKEPQLIVNRVTPMSSYVNGDITPEDTVPVIEEGTLYIRLPSETDAVYGKIKAILNMFPGNNAVVLYFADTGVRRGTKCALYKTMLKELNAVLGKENVVIK